MKKFLKGNKIFESVITVIMVIVLSVLIISTVNSSRRGEKSICGLKFYIVLSGSMSPTINTGSMIILKPVDTEKIIVGDIITFDSKWNSSNLTTHRVINIDNEKQLSFTTKGDANKVPDPNPVLGESIKGKVILSIPYVGYVVNFLKTPIGLMTIITIIILSISINKFHLKNKEGD